MERIKKTSLQKGDKILLKRGEVFNGILDITGKGTYTHPIIIDAYGEGNQKPCIAGNDTSMYAVRIFNSDYFTIQNLGNSGNAGDYSCGNIGSIVRYNISIGDGIRPKETRQGMFSPSIHIAGPVKQTLVERNIIHANLKPSDIVDRTMITSDSWDGYADSTCFRQNIYYVAEPSRFDFTSSTRNAFEENIYIGQFKNLPENPKNKKAENFYTEKVLKESADGYKGLHCLMDSIKVKEHTLHYIKPEAIKTFFQSIF